MTRFVGFICPAVLLLASLCTTAQEVPAPPDPSADAEAMQSATPPPQPPHNARITGTVLCADTHRPARGAMIMVVPVPSADGKVEANVSMPSMARVASDGTYVVGHIAAGEYGVIAMLPGYLSPMDDLTSGDLSETSPEKARAFIAKYGAVSVRPQEMARYDISLQRGAAVSGRVLYSDGSPASQVMIDVQDVNAKPTTTKSPADSVSATAIMRTFFMHQSQGTDDQGHYRISRLRPGTYRVAAVEAPTEPMNALLEEGMGLFTGGSSNSANLHIYSGDTLHRKAAKTYELRSGDEAAGVDITVPTDAFHRIQGRLSATDGRSITMAYVTLTDTTDDSLVFRSVLSRDGSFVFATVPAGSYTLAATAARIGTVPTGFPDNIQLRPEMIQATNAFADGNMAVIVKESDLADINLTLKEVPFAPSAQKPEMQNGGEGPLP